MEPVSRCAKASEHTSNKHVKTMQLRITFSRFKLALASHLSKIGRFYLNVPYRSTQNSTSQILRPTQMSRFFSTIFDLLMHLYIIDFGLPDVAFGVIADRFIGKDVEAANLLEHDWRELGQRDIQNSFAVAAGNGLKRRPGRLRSSV